MAVKTQPPGARRTGYRNPRCYAGALEDCSQKTSREHPISAAILHILNRTGGLKVSGVGWLPKGAEKRLSPDALASKILCSRHNSALHGLDEKASRLFRALDQIHLETGGKPADHAADRLFHFNGHDIERWVLKVLCGFAASGTMPLVPTERTASPLPQKWLSVLWGEEPMPAMQGLYFLGGVGTDYKPRASVEFASISEEATGALVGMQMSLYGIGLGLSMIDRRAFSGAIFRPIHLLFTGRGMGRKAIQFGWDRSGDGVGPTIDWTPTLRSDHS